MKMFRIFLACLFLVQTWPAHAQYQVPNHSVPVGRGVGVQGYGNATPGTAGAPLISNGAASDPSFQQVGTSGIASNSITNNLLATMLANTIKCNPTGGTANAQDCTGTQVAASMGLSLTLPVLDPHAGRWVPLIAGTVGGVTCNTTSPFNCFQLCQFRGNQYVVNGAYVAIPSGGCVGAVGGVMAALTNACIENTSFVTTCGQSLAAATTYYVYLGFVSGTLTMIFSVNVYSYFTSLLGNAVMSGDATRSLIGLLRTDPSTATVTGTGNQQNSASWQNPVWNGLQAAVTGSFSAASFSNIGTCNSSAFTNCITYVQFSDNVVNGRIDCALVVGAATVTATIGIGVATGGTPATLPAVTSAILVTTAVSSTGIDTTAAVGDEGFVILNALGLSDGSHAVSVTSCQLSLPSRMPS